MDDIDKLQQHDEILHRAHMQQSRRRHRRRRMPVLRGPAAAGHALVRAGMPGRLAAI